MKEHEVGTEDCRRRLYVFDTYPEKPSVTFGKFWMITAPRTPMSKVFEVFEEPTLSITRLTFMIMPEMTTGPMLSCAA